MAAPKGLEDLRFYLHSRQIDHAWLRSVLHQYLQRNIQSDGGILDDHLVWDFRNTIEQFAILLDEDPENLEDDESED